LRDLQKKIYLVPIRGAAAGLEMIANMVTPIMLAEDRGIPRYSYLEHQSKFGLSYKWMDAGDDKCGTGKCSGTVMFAGQCVPQNEVGNMALMLLFAMAAGIEGADAMNNSFTMARLLEIVGTRPDNSAAFLMGMQLYIQLSPSQHGTTSEPQGTFLGELPPDWLTEVSSDSGWAALTQRLSNVMNAVRHRNPGPKEFFTTGRGVDTRECESCGKTLENVNGDEIFGKLADRFRAYKGGGGTASLSEWLEAQVPEALRRPGGGYYSY
jgi:hypothetical protein